MDPQWNQFETQKENPYSGYYGTGAPKKPKGGGGWLIFFAVLLVVTALISVFAKRYTVRIDREAGSVSVRVVPKSAVSEEWKEPDERLPDDPEDKENVFITEVSPEKEGNLNHREEAAFSETELVISDFTPAQPEMVPTEGGALSLQQIYKKMSPSVVSIISVSQSGTSTGTGIVMSEDGYVITNHHVIEGSQFLTVLLSDNREFDAELVGADAVSDLAVLKISGTGLVAAEFGDSTLVQVGDTVVAIGDPLGIELRGTMTDGIISAINRDLTTNGRTLTLLQTNAELNNGNSGGPLINIYGQVIGINTMKMGSYYSGSVEGLGFAIPVSTAKPIIDELIEKGYVSGRPALGIQGDAVPGYAQAYYHLPEGVYVSYVVPQSDAKNKGLEEGDIITAIEGTSISSIDELNTVRNQFVAGDTVRLTIFRSGKYYEVDVVLMDQNDAD